MRYYKKRNYRKKTYKKKTYAKKTAAKVSRNTKNINKLVKSTLVKTYWQHNDERVGTAFPNVAEPVYRSFTPLIPTTFNLLFNKMTAYSAQQKVRINNCKVNLTLTLANASQNPQPIDYSIFCVKIKPRMRAQFYGQSSGVPNHQITLYPDIHYTGNVPAGMETPNNLANIRLNPDIFKIHYYKHGYFSTVIKNATAPGGAGISNTGSIQIRRCSFSIPYNCELKSDSWNEAIPGAPTSDRTWTDLTQDEIPLFNRYHIFVFTSGYRDQINPPDPVTKFGNTLQCAISTLFNCTSAN